MQTIETNQSIKPRVRNLRAYSLSADRASVKLNQNENPFDLPPRIMADTLRRMQSRAWSRYPEFMPTTLHERLAAFSGWRADGVVAGNGSNELIQALLITTVGEGTRVLISEPTFALYRQITTILGGEIISVSLSSDFRFDAATLGEAIQRERPAVTILCSPNNPTGCRLADDHLESLLDATDGLIAVDEAYHEFAEASVVKLLSTHPNLIVFRTFSKAMALAALRVGYLLASPPVAHEIGKAVLPYNLNAFSQAAAEVALEFYESDLRPLVNKIIAERGRLFEALLRIDGFAPIRSCANFMIVRSAIRPRVVFEELLKRDILIRDLSSYPMLGEFFRVSVGTPEENDRLIAALGEIGSR